MPNKPDELTFQQLRFARLYFENGGNASDAAKQLKISKSSGQRWKSLPQIKEMLIRFEQQAMQSYLVDRNFLISSNLQIHDRCMQVEPVLDLDGKPTGEFKFDPKNALAALREVADICGFKNQKLQLKREVKENDDTGAKQVVFTLFTDLSEEDNQDIHGDYSP